MSGIDITFVIGNPVEQDLVRNSFNIVVRHMHGDMNGYSTVTCAGTLRRADGSKRWR